MNTVAGFVLELIGVLLAGVVLHLIVRDYHTD